MMQVSKSKSRSKALEKVKLNGSVGGGFDF